MLCVSLFYGQFQLARWCCMCLPYLFFWILSQSRNIECRIINALFIISVTLFFQNTVLSSHNTFSQVSGFIPSGFLIFFITGGSESFHPCLFLPRMVLTLCPSQVYVNAMLAQYVLLNNTLLFFEADFCLFSNYVWEGWMLERDSGPWPMHQYRLAVLAWVKRQHHNPSILIESCS